MTNKTKQKKMKYSQNEIERLNILYTKLKSHFVSTDKNKGLINKKDFPAINRIRKLTAAIKKHKKRLEN